MPRQPDQRPGAVARRIVAEYLRMEYGASDGSLTKNERWLQRRIAAALRRAAKGGR
jgi:hypothetical protein